MTLHGLGYFGACSTKRPTSRRLEANGTERHKSWWKERNHFGLCRAAFDDDRDDPATAPHEASMLNVVGFLS
jgi:hypothetical protein